MDQTPVSFRIANNEPLNDDLNRIALDLAWTTIRRAFEDQDGSITIELSPTEIKFNYAPTPKKHVTPINY